MITSLTFITGNQAKVKWLQKYLQQPISHQKIDLVEIQSLDLAEIVQYKAKEAFQQIHKPVLVEDTSLVFTALNKLPGPLIKWFLETLGNEGLCRLLDTYPDRSATASVMYGLYTGTDFYTFVAEKKGTIAPHSRGENGFGWDKAFIPEGATKTWGEMTDEEQETTSLRKIAVDQLNQFLQKNQHLP